MMFTHIWPNATAPIIVQATVSVSYAILAEASLSFLGLGVEATTPTWGLDSLGFTAKNFITRPPGVGVRGSAVFRPLLQPLGSGLRAP
jgi:peptide/nickel transport system permease protein